MLELPIGEFRDLAADEDEIVGGGLPKPRIVYPLPGGQRNILGWSLKMPAL